MLVNAEGSEIFGLFAWLQLTKIFVEEPPEMSPNFRAEHFLRYAVEPPSVRNDCRHSFESVGSVRTRWSYFCAIPVTLRGAEA